MNILLICDEYPPGKHGGIGTAVQLMARTMVKMGHTVVVAGFYHYGYGGADEFEDEGVKVFRFRQMLASAAFKNQDSLAVRIVTRVLSMAGIFEWDIKKSMNKYAQFLQNIIRDYKIDIAELPDYHDYMRFCNHVVHFPKLSIPSIVKLHGSMTYFNEEAGAKTPKHIREMETMILNNADAVASVSQYTAEKTAQYLQYQHPVAILYNGINIPEKNTLSPKVKGMVVFTGSLVEKKGIYPLMKAWNIIIAQCPYAKLYIFGKGVVEKMQVLLDKNARDTVYFKGHVSREELYQNLALAEVAVFPSFAETFGLAPVEAMACGTAVVFSKLTSGPEIVQDGVTGLLVEPRDEVDIAEKVINLLADEDFNSKLALAGKAYVANVFNINIVAQKHIEFYDQVIRSHAGE